MPRIRTLKPEHRQHRKVGALTHRQYRLWVGMICEADDEGRLVADPTCLRVTIFGYHDVSDDHVRQDVAELARVGLIRAYLCHGTAYAVFPDWRMHQRIDKPRPSKLPAPTVRERSKRHRGTIRDDSPSILAGSEGIKDQGRDQGSEGIGREGSGEGNPKGAHAPNGPDPGPTNATTRGPQSDDEVAAYARVLGITSEAARQRLAARS